MANLSVRGKLKSKKYMEMPHPVLVLEFDDLSCDIMKREKRERSDKISMETSLEWRLV